MKKWLSRIGIGIVLVLVVLVVVNWTFLKQIATFSPVFMPRVGAAPESEAEARAQDVEYLAALVDYDRSFDETARAEFDELIARGRQEAASMSLADLYLLAARATALADNGHTTVYMDFVPPNFASAGARYFHFTDGLYILRARAEYESLVGRRVVEIDGQPIDSVLATLKTYFGGRDRWRQLWAIQQLEYPEILHAAGVVAEPTGYTVTVEDEAGATQAVDLVAQAPPDATPVRERFPRTTLAAGALPDEGEEWARSLQNVDGDSVPLYLQQADQLYFWQPIEGGGGYLRLQELINGQQTMAEFFAQTIEPVPDGSLPYLVVDLRDNPGGDITLFAEIAQWLPDKVAADGHLYIAVGPQTFSAGLNAAAVLKYYGGEKSMIIGSPMGGREQYWAEHGLPFRLPNSGIYVGYATGYHDWANGCEDHPYCFTQVLIHGVPAGSLAPVHTIEADYASYAAGRDLVMEWVYQQELA